MTREPRNILSQHKVSITNPRIIVLDTLLDFGNPITIEELQSKLKGKVAKSTLYRVLNDLKKINILNEFTSPDNSVVVELSDEFEMMLVKEMEKVQKELNFEIKDHRVEMFGLCTDECSNCK